MVDAPYNRSRSSTIDAFVDNSRNSDPFLKILPIVSIFGLALFFISCGPGFNFYQSLVVNGWQFVDGNGSTGLNKDTTKTAQSPQLTTLNTKLYAAWQELNSTGYQIRVGVYNGNDSSPSWKLVDGNGANGINYNSGLAAVSPQLTTFNNKVYATWQESTASKGSTQIRETVYNGNDSAPSWAFVDGNGTNGLNFDKTQNGTVPQGAVSNSKLYSVWTESNGSFNQTRVAVYNGNDSSPVWKFVDGAGTNGINYNTARDANQPQLSALGLKLYGTWTENNGSAYQIRVVVYNGNDGAPAWSLTDGGGTNGLNYNSANSATSPRLAAFNSKLYLTWYEQAPIVNQIRVAVYNGKDSTPAWKFVDGAATGLNAHSNRTAISPQLLAFQSNLYATWSEIDNTTFASVIKIAVYNGNDSAPAWTFVDNRSYGCLNKDNTQNGQGPQLASLNYRLYAIWNEYNTSSVSQIRSAVGLCNGGICFVPNWQNL